jgi:hypothetical protein
MIQPIETKYQGYRFRSRLEARWAVFFDHLKLHWEYEKEGFYIGKVMYLPDFYVIGESGDGWFVEVKGNLLDTESVDKAEALHREPPPYAKGCLLVGGVDMPELGQFRNHMNDIADTLLADRSLKRVMEAVEAARSARFQNGWR